MSFFDRKPFIFQIVITAMSLFFLTLSLINFIEVITSVTDENRYTYLIPFLYVKHEFIVEIPADSVKARELNGSDTLKVGDIILAINGERIDSSGSLNKIMKKIDDKDYIKLSILKLPENISKMRKIKKRDFSSENIRFIPNGLVVFDVFEGGASDRAGMKKGDVILKMDGKEFKTSKEVYKHWKKQKPGKKLTFEILRKNQLLTLNVKLVMRLEN